MSFLLKMLIPEAAGSRLFLSPQVKDAGQGGLVGEARLNRDLGERQRRRHHRML